MLLAFVLIVVGLAATVYGVRLASERRRPVDLAGALLAAAGLALALLGAGRLLSDRFL
jgi:drug/metabolite transporter (DMT)-like permease